MVSTSVKRVNVDEREAEQTSGSKHCLEPCHRLEPSTLLCLVLPTSYKSMQCCCCIISDAIWPAVLATTCHLKRQRMAKA